MNQPEYRYKIVRCVKCGQKIEVRQVFQRNPPEWVTIEISMCRDCLEKSLEENEIWNLKAHTVW